MGAIRNIAKGSDILVELLSIREIEPIVKTTKEIIKFRWIEYTLKYLLISHI